MFEALSERATRLAEARARARREELCGKLAGCLPPGVRAENGRDGVRLSGRALRRRLARDGSLAATIAGALK